MSAQCGAGDGTDGLTGVVSEVPLVGISQSAGLEKGGVCEQAGRGDCGVVDGGYVNEVEDWKALAHSRISEGLRTPTGICVLVANHIATEGGIDHWR